MSLKEIKDKLEIGLKPDAPYRPNNLPESEQAEKQDELVKEFSGPGDTGDPGIPEDDEVSVDPDTRPLHPPIPTKRRD